MNRGSTARSQMTPLGNEDFPRVRSSNKMVSRIVVAKKHVLVLLKYSFQSYIFLLDVGVYISIDMLAHIC